MKKLILSLLVAVGLIGSNSVNAQTGSSLNFKGWTTNQIYQSIWGPGSNGFDLSGGAGGGLGNGSGDGVNCSTQQGVGWSTKIGTNYVTSYSLQSSGGWVNGSWVWVSDPTNGSYMPANGDPSFQYLAAVGKLSTINLTVPAGVVLEVWDLNNFTVVASNISNPGNSVTFTAKPLTKYGGYAWYSNNKQSDLAINVKYVSANPPVPIPLPQTTQVTFSQLGSPISIASIKSFVFTSTTASGATITYTSSVPSVISISGNRASVLKKGTTTITTTIAAKGIFPSTTISQSLKVN